jgi:hypothetical protein
MSTALIASPSTREAIYSVILPWKRDINVMVGSIW